MTTKYIQGFPEYILWSLGKIFIRPQHIKIFETVQQSNSKIVSKEAAE